MFYDEEGNFSGQLFLQYLHIEGRKNEYIGSEEFFNSRPDIPPYFDQLKIKKAQCFFHKNITSMLTVSMAGLMSLLSDPYGIRFLLVTNKSSEPLSAYKRYRDTLFHMISWYQGEFSPGSELMRSLITVRHMHNAAVKQGSKVGLKNIDQAELTLSQFGFMGFALAKQKEFGLESASTEDLDALVHFWRVIGYLMGVRDEFNMCRESLEETRSICKAALEKLGEALTGKHIDCLMLQFAALDGGNLVFPTINSKLFMNFIYELVFPDDQERQKYSYEMNYKDTFEYNAFKKGLILCKYNLFRDIVNENTHKILYITKNYPEIVEHHIRGTDLLTLI